MKAYKIKYMIMSQDQNAGQSHNIMINNSYFERMNQFKYLGKSKRTKILFRKKLRED